MNQIDVTCSAIEANETFTDALKENFNELITIFHQKFPEVDLNNFNERIKGMEVKKGSKLTTKDAIEYNPKENVLYLNVQKLEEVDAKHELMYAIITMISAYEHGFGISEESKLKVINVGMTEMLANFLVGNDIDESKNMNRKQKASQLTNLILKLGMPIDEAKKAYFSHDANAYIKAIATISKDPTEMINILAEASYEIENNEPLNGISNYGRIQNKIINQLITPVNVDFFKTECIFKAEIIGGTCPDIDKSEMLIGGIEQQSIGFEKAIAA